MSEARSRACRSAADDYVPSRSSRANWCCGRQYLKAHRAAAGGRRWSRSRFGPYVYHLDRGELRKGEQTVHLTDREREMMRILRLWHTAENRAAQPR